MESAYSFVTYLFGAVFVLVICIGLWRFLKAKRAWRQKRQFHYSAGAKVKPVRTRAARTYDTRNRVPIRRA